MENGDDEILKNVVQSTFSGMEIAGEFGLDSRFAGLTIIEFKRRSN
jgi:hypothetical protein